MAPSPAAGKKGAPQTPTKAGKNPASSTTPKLGAAGDKAKDTPSTSARKPPKLGASKANTPKSGNTDSPKLPPRPKNADKAEKDVKGKAPASEAETETGSEADKIGLTDNDPEETPGKVTQQAGAESSAAGDTDLSEAAPEPIDDDDADDEDTVSGARDNVDDTADDAADEAEETGDDAGEASGAGGGVGGALSSATSAVKGAAGKAKDTATGAAGQATGSSEGATGGATDDATDKAKDGANGVKDTAEEGAEGAKDTAEDAADGVKDKTESAADDAEGVADDAKSTAEDVADDAKDKAEGATDDANDKAEGATDDVEDKAEGATDDAEDKAEGATGDVSDGGAIDDVKDTAEDAKSTAEDVADDAKSTAEDAAEDAKSTAEDAAEDVEDALPEVPLSILKGLEVGEDGQILDKHGEPIGQIDEGDPEDLVGQVIGEDGEILDEDGDAIGRVSIIPEKEKEIAQKMKEEAEAKEAEAEETAEDAADGVKTEVPDIGILEGLKVGEGGEILDESGKAVGKVTEGDPEDFVGQEINAEGEVLDEDGDVIGRVEALPQEVKDEVDELKPDLSIIEGKKLNKKGNILDDEGEVIAKLVDGEAKDCAGKIPNEKGEILNDDGEVIGRVEIVPGEAADELMKELHPELLKDATDGVPDISTLEGLKVNKKGEVLDEEGEPIGKLIEGELADVAGKKINDKGEILDKDGNVVGKVEALAKAEEAAEAAQDAAEDAKDAAEEAADKAPDFSSVEGLKVNKKGEVLNEDGEVIATLAEGFDAADVLGKKINENGEILDADGNVIGKVDLAGQGEEEGEDTGPELPPLSILEGLKCNKSGKIVDSDGNVVGELIEGDAKKLSKLGITSDAEGQFWDSRGNVIGRAQTLPAEDPEAEAAFAGLEGLIVVKDGWVEDENSNRVGQITEGDPKKLVGRLVDEDGDIIDKRGNVIGHAERYEDPEEEAATPDDLSILKGLTCNKQGNVIGPDGVPIAKLIEGNPKELAGRKIDGEGQIWNDAGNVVGRCELIPENEREAKPEGPFAGIDGVIMVKDGFAEDADGNVVGKLSEGDPKKLVGRAVDEDGDINDKYGNTIGHVEPYEVPEEEEAAPEDLSSLAGKIVNKQGMVVDEHGTVFGRIREGDPSALAGKKVDGEGQIWSDDGKIIGYAELIPGGDKFKKEGPFSGFERKVVVKDGLVVEGGGEIIGHIIEGNPKELLGRNVDDDGEIQDKNGNVIGKAERWEPEEKERRISPMSGRHVNKEGEVRDEDGNLIGKLTEGDPAALAGFEIDDNGYVIDNDGNRVGACTLIENIIDEEGLSEEEIAALRAEQQNREIAKKMCGILTQTLEKIEPVLKQITDAVEKADRTPKEELDEEELVKQVKPLIEEGGRILNECNGSLRGLDPDGSIAATAKARAAQGDATQEEHRLAELLKELTTNVVKTIDNARKRINDMPHAKKKLNPLWYLLSEPLFQIIAAVGLLLSGVLGLVGKLLNGLGLGGLVSGLLGGLGVDKLLGGLGLGSIGDSLGLGGKKKK